MKFAILGDIHSNLAALDAVLADARQQGVTDYVCVGDIVGYNANPRECLEIVRSLQAVAVRGNHDHYCSHEVNLKDFHSLAAEVVQWTREVLSTEELSYLRNLPLSAPVETFTIVHATLDTPEMWGYVFDKFEAESHFNYQTTSVCFYGHTHVPIAFERSDYVRAGVYTRIKVRLGKKYFINVGSVGQPRDGDPRAAYVVYDLMDNMIELRRVAYDISLTQKRIKEEGLPERLALRLATGR